MYGRFYARLEGVVGTLVVGAILCHFFSKKKLKPDCESEECDDSCGSLFYDETRLSASDGSGFPFTCTCRTSVVGRMSTVHPEYRRLDASLYEQACSLLPIFCVDVVLKRKSDGKILLFLRKDEPAAKIWWLPGGRMFKGETFFDCAKRKVVEETGTAATVSTVGVLGVWNTFFPHSCWDENRVEDKRGTHTVNVAVMAIIDDEGGDKSGFNANAMRQFAVESTRWIEPLEAMATGTYDKYVRLTTTAAFKKGYLRVMGESEVET
jgi:colanic acid biosynthesis protein WcaH